MFSHLRFRLGLGSGLGLGLGLGIGLGLELILTPVLTLTVVVTRMFGSSVILCESIGGPLEAHAKNHAFLWGSWQTLFIACVFSKITRASPNAEKRL